MNRPPDILRKILRRKAAEVVAASAAVPLRDLSRRAESAPPTRGFGEALRRKLDAGDPAVIAEIKRASPSRGTLRENLDPAAIAADYEQAGAAALSVLTDREFFRGSADDLVAAREAGSIPVLRKDFVVDQYQIYESRVIGADCVLLIVAALGDAGLVELAGLASHLGLDVLVEVHDEPELERALMVGAPIIGINNRDLRTFETTLETTLRLREQIPDDRLVVTESGIHSAEDVALMRSHRVHAFLVGEAFMTAREPGAMLAKLFA